MPQFSEEDINAARRRVQEMKNRASRFTADDTPPAVHTNVNEATEKMRNPAPQINESDEEKEQKKVNIPENEDNDSNNSFFVILAVLMLLSKENADNKLILALLYLLL
ncbi:MAG: hypothetical protein J1E36_01305 [Eubacterium sp.]|nr:hypothetical protein [Eubacterium sp.]